MGFRASLATAALGGVLLLTLARELEDGADWYGRTQPAGARIAAMPDRGGGPAAPASPEPADASDILARPLFNWNRRPGVAGGTGADTPLPRLSGILVSASDRFAIFAGPPDGKSQVVAQGGMIGQFTIDTIDLDHVILKRGAETQTLHLSFSVAPPPPMATPDAS